MDSDREIVKVVNFFSYFDSVFSEEGCLKDDLKPRVGEELNAF